jgi:hypothetical protein
MKIFNLIRLVVLSSTNILIELGHTIIQLDAYDFYRLGSFYMALMRQVLL